MLSQRLANIIFATVMLIASAWFAWMAQAFETSGLLASSGLPSKFFPQLTLGFIALCAIIVIGTYALRGSAGGDDNETVFEDAGEARRGVLMLAVAVLCYFIWLNFGFLPMAAVIGPLSLLVMGIRSPWIYLTVIVLTVVIYFVFTRLLGVQLT